MEPTVCKDGGGKKEMPGTDTNMSYERKIEESSSLDELFKIWKTKKPDGEINHIHNYFIADGIVNPVVWKSGEKKKILFILKEAYGTDWETNTLATWLKNVHPKDRMWKRIARMVYGIENTTAKSIQRYNLHELCRGKIIKMW